MKEIIFIGRDEYEGDEELYAVHRLPTHILYSVAFTEYGHLLLSFYKEREDFIKSSSLCNIHIHLKCVNEFDDEVIIEAVEYVDNCTVFDAASRFIMDYMTSQIQGNKHINSRELGVYVREKYDEYIRYCVTKFAETEEGKDLIETNKRITERAK